MWMKKHEQLKPVITSRMPVHGGFLTEAGAAQPKGGRMTSTKLWVRSKWKRTRRVAEIEKGSGERS